METHLLQDLAIAMAAAGAMTLLCHRFRQPVVIGYLLAGLVIGPYTPPFAFVQNLKNIHTMAELGLVFLLFSLGLEFSLPKIRRVGLSAGVAALLEVVGMLAIGYVLGQAFGWSRMDSLFLGAILSISSTTIIVKVFMDFRMMQEKFVQVVFGILVLEDIVAVAILSVLSGLGGQGGPDASAVAFSLLNIGLFVTLFLVLGLLLVPPFVHWVAGLGSKEALGIVTLATCLGGAFVAHASGLSVALGAFLAGAILAASREIHQIEEWIHPVRDMFSAIFFVSAGMLIQPELLWQYKGPIAIVTLVTLVGKVLSGAVGSFVVGYDLKTSARVGMSLAQIGEFSFVIASLGLSLNVTSDFLYPLAIMVSSLTTLATPYLIRNSDRLVDGALAFLPAPVRAGLDRYQRRVEGAMRPPDGGHGTSVFSRYLIRLAVYVALFVAGLLLMRALSSRVAALGVLGERQAAAMGVAWTLALVVSLPLLRALSKYADHIVLLLVTRSHLILSHLNVHMFYALLYRATMTGLIAIVLYEAYPYVPSANALIAIGFAVSLLSALARRALSSGQELLEKGLDLITGLATSEPTRQAVLRSGERSVILVDITDQVRVRPGSEFEGKPLREIRLRERTGATVVAIYREGSHIANPGPDTSIAADDVLVLLGNESELIEAAKLFA